MRLTLRTMLAHLDGVLDAGDAAEITKKIDDSKFASDLVAKIRSLLRNPRLGAPRLEGKGMGLDPNSVADYLETLLPADRVPDFEKICLESDMHLAEVAACHQILAMVLGQPADLTPISRDRMYRIGARVADSQAKKGDSQIKKSAAAGAAASPTAKPKVDPATERAVPTPKSSAPVAAIARDGKAAGAEKATREQPTRRDEKPARNEVSPREKPEVPDYLREARRRPIWPLLATVLFAFVLAGVLLRAIGPFDRTHPLAHLVLGSNTDEVAQNEAAQNEAAQNNGGTPGAPVPGAKTPGETVTPAKPAIAKTAGDATPLPPGPTEIPAGTPGDDVAKPAPLPAEPSTPAKEPGDLEGDPAAATPSKPAEPKPVEPAPVDPGELKPSAPKVAKPAKPEPVEPDPPAKPEVPIETGMVVGRFVSDQQLLARFDAKTGEWLRLPNEAPLHAGDRLLVLPTYRPQVSLVSGLQLTVAGESLIQLLPPDERGVAQIKVEYGRVLVVSSGKPGAQVGLDMVHRQGLASFDNVDSALALEVRRFRYPGDFPERVAATMVSELFPTNGSITWAETGGESVAIGAGEVRIYEADKPGNTAELGEQPDWVKGRGMNPIDRLASQTLAERLPAERSLLLSLQERVEPSKETRVEVRSLAIRSLMYLEVYEPFVQALNDDKLKSFWGAQFDTMQESLTRGPEAAGEVRKAFEALRSEDAASLYRLLLGYSPEELERVGATKLIEYLDHEALDFRVLASESLLRITGKTLSYRPEVAPPRRIQPVQRWKQEQKTGMLVYKLLPSPLVDRKAVSKSPAPAKDPVDEP